jgi:hypothetical protein
VEGLYWKKQVITFGRKEGKNKPVSFPEFCAYRFANR